MKKKGLITLSILIVMFVMASTNVFGAIEIKPNVVPHYNISISDAYTLSYNLRASSSTLGNNNLDPHLSTAEDWGAVAYLSASVYGNNMNPTYVNIGNTAGNNTGVMNFGTNQTGASTGYGTYLSGINIGASNSSFWSQLYNNRSTKYVSNHTPYGKGMALEEVARLGGS